MMRFVAMVGLALALASVLAACGHGTADSLTPEALDRTSTARTPNSQFNALTPPDLTPAELALKPDNMDDRAFAFAYDVFRKTNAYRANNAALGQLVWNKDVAAVAAAHGMDLRDANRFTHDSVGPRFAPCQNLQTPNGGICIPMRLTAGAPTPVAPIGRSTENLAWQTGPFSADQALTLWINSPGHKANLDDAGVTQLGVGYVESPTGNLYVQVFYRP